jgi:hypothetical protein
LILKDPKSLPSGLNGQAKLKGFWGFEAFEGPEFHLLSSAIPGNWKLLPADEENLMAGQANAVHLLSSEAGSSETITLATDNNRRLTWKPDKPGEIELPLPLTRLVRLPKIMHIVCPETVDKLCRLDGANLFLINALSVDEKFSAPMVVPEGFANTSIAVPRPNGPLFYLKLRDAPETVNRLLVPVFPETDVPAGATFVRSEGL